MHGTLVLFDKPKGWSSLDGQLKWQVSEKARNLCNLDEPFLVPLQSAPHDIQQSLNISDRSKLVNAKGKHEGAHPMNEVLEIELEILLLVRRNI